MIFILPTFDQTVFTMLVERTNDDQIMITLPSKINSFGLQRLIGYIKYLEATSNSIATQEDVDELAAEVNASWWYQNRSRFIK